MARIAFFGAGYAGLVSGACFADLGHTVVIRDVVPERIDGLRAGRLPFFEPGLAELIERNADRLSFTLSMKEAIEGSEFLFVCVGTPPTASGDANLSAVWSVIEDLPQDLGPVVLVMKSTVPVGTGEKVRAELDRRGLTEVGYASCPEFLAEGTAVRDFLEPDRVVVGAFDPVPAEAVAALHEALDAPVVQMDVPSAEMVKLAANAYLATRISFINEIANVCELVGADVEDVARGMGLDRRIGTQYLRAGIGFGGSCFPKDVSFLKLLAGNSGYHFHLVSSVDRGERAPDPPAGREGAAASRHAAREACRPARACVQGAHGRRSRGAEPGACRPVPGRGSTGRRLGPGRRRARDPARCRVRGRRRRRARRRGRRRRRHRVARAPGAPVGRAPRDDAEPAGRRRPQLPRRRRDANGRLRLRGHGPRGLAVRRARGDGGARLRSSKLRQ